MKNLTFLLLQLLCIHAVPAQDSVRISGRILNAKGEFVRVNFYTDPFSYEDSTACSARLAPDGHFRMAFPWPKPMSARLSHGGELTELFLAPGDNLEMTLDTDAFDETLTYSGAGSRINNYLAKQYLAFEDDQSPDYALAKDDFMVALDTAFDNGMAYLQGHFPERPFPDDATRVFVEEQEADLYYSRVQAFMDYPFLNAFETGNKKIDLGEEYTSFLASADTYRPGALASFSYMRFLTGYLDRGLESALEADMDKQEGQFKEAWFASDLPNAVKDVMLASWAYEAMVDELDPEKGEQLISLYRELADDPHYLSRLTRIYNRIAALAPGNPAPGFTLEDIDGRAVSLEDFRGKLIYLDFWASWCGPCIAEVPDAKKMKDALKGKDIAFVYISLDQDKEAWLNAVAKHGLEGTHLIAAGGFDDEVSRAYNISGIPQYMLIDRNGKIIDANAPRPSERPEQEIRKYLKQ